MNIPAPMSDEEYEGHHKNYLYWGPPSEYPQYFDWDVESALEELEGLLDEESSNETTQDTLSFK